eukprot:8237257-Pyramimonas_sp.AAC.1
MIPFDCCKQLCSSSTARIVKRTDSTCQDDTEHPIPPQCCLIVYPPARPEIKTASGCEITNGGNNIRAQTNC